MPVLNACACRSLWFSKVRQTPLISSTLNRGGSLPPDMIEYCFAFTSLLVASTSQHTDAMETSMHPCCRCTYVQHDRHAGQALAGHNRSLLSCCVTIALLGLRMRMLETIYQAPNVQRWFASRYCPRSYQIGSTSATYNPSDSNMQQMPATIAVAVYQLRSCQCHDR